MGVQITGKGGLAFSAEIETTNFRKQAEELKATSRKVSQETVAGIKQEMAARREQQGAIERVKAKLEDLKASQSKASAAQLPGINKDIQAYSAELVRLKKIGTDAFEGQNREGSRFISILDRMSQAAAVYRRGIQEATNTENIAKYNRKLQEITAEINRLSNAGKRGFDAMGRPIKEQEGLIQRLERQVRLYRKGVQEATNTANIEKYNQKLRESQAELAKLSAIGVAANAKEQLGTQQKLQRLAEIYKTGAASSTNPELIAKYNRKLQETEIQINRVANVGKAGFDQLGNKIQGSTNMAGKLWGGLKTVANILPGLGIAGLLAFAIDPIIDYISKIDLFKKKTDEVAEARKRLANVALAGNQNAQSEITTLRSLYSVATDTTIAIDKRKAAVDKLQKEYPKYLGNIKDEVILAGNAKAAYDKLTESILSTARARAAEDAITENSKKQLELESQLIDLRRERERLDKRLNAAQEKLIASTQSASLNDGSAFALGRVSDVQGDIKDNQKEQKDLQKEYNKLQKENERLAKNINQEVKKGADLVGAEVDKSKEGNKLLAERARLLGQIYGIEAEFNRKFLIPEKEALQAVTDRFVKISNAVDAFNKKNPKIAIGTTGLDATRDKAIDDLKYKQQTERLKIALEEQKVLVATFEKYREELGETAANERFGKEVQMAKESTVRALEELNKLNAIPAKDLNGGQFARREALAKWAKEEEKLEQERFERLVEGLQNYEQQRNLISERYQREREKLLLAGNLTAIAELDKFYKEDLGNLDDANAQKLEQFKKLFNGVDRLSTENAKAVVETADAKLKELVSEDRISKQMAEEIQLLLKQTSRSISDRLPKQLGNLASQIGSMAGAVSQVNEEFGALLGTVGNVIGGVANIKNSIDAIKDAQEKGGIEGILGAAGGVAGAVGAAISIAQGIANAIERKDEARAQRREEQRQYAEQLQVKAIEAQTQAMNRQLDLIKDLYGTERLTEYSKALDEINKKYNEVAQTISNKFILTGNKETDDYLKKVMAGTNTVIDDLNNLATKTKIEKGLMPTLDGIIGGLKDIKTNASSIEELQRLLDKGLLDDATAASVKALIELGEKYKETFNLIRAELTGTTLDSIIDEVGSIFEKGLLPGAEEFGQSFEQIMKRAITNSFKRQFLEKQLQGFYDAFFEASQDELTEEEIAELEKMYNAIISKAGEEFKKLQEIAGINFGGQDEEQRGLAGAIKGITADQADLLAGQFSAMRMAHLESVSLQRTQSGTWVSVQEQIEKATEFNRMIWENSLTAIQQREQIIANTARTVDELKVTTGELVKQTQVLSSSNNYLRSMDTTSKNQYDGLRANGYA